VLGIVPVLPTPIGPRNRDYPTDAFRQMLSIAPAVAEVPITPTGALRTERVDGIMLTPLHPASAQQNEAQQR
jgi:hypothetical protein